MISRRSGALLVSLGASLTLTACVSQGSSGGGGGSSSSSSGSSGGSAAAGGSVTIGVVMATTRKSGELRPLLDNQDGCSLLLHRVQRVEDGVDSRRGQAQGGFIEHEQLGPGQ